MSANSGEDSTTKGANTSVTDTPTPTPRVSLPVRCSNPDNPNSERQIHELSVDHLLIKEADLTVATNSLLAEVNEELRDIDKSLIHVALETISTENSENSQNTKILQTNQEKLLDWSSNDTVESTNQGIKLLVNQKPLEIMGDKNQPTGSGVLGPQLTTDISNNPDLSQLIDLKIQEIMRTRDSASSRHGDSISNNQIGLQDAIRLLPKSFDGKDTENLEIFLEKCEFVVSCVVEPAIPRLLQAIQTRLTGKARQVTKFKTFDTWEELRETLKTSLEPQRTTQHLFLELYAIKQKNGEDILTYSMRVEALQNLIIEQETADFSPEIAQAMEISIKRQVIQVFMEGLGNLKDYIKARNPLTLDKAIQAAREEERIRMSSEESKKLYKGNAVATKKPNGSCNICNKPGHWARDCRSNRGNNTNQSKNSSTPHGTSKAAVNTITCQYCKKPGHTKDVCRKLKYVTGKRNEAAQAETSENQNQPGASGGRPVGSIKSAAISFPESSH